MTTVPIMPGVATVTLNGSGDGTANVGPVGPNEVWSPATAAVSVATNVNEASCKIYIGPEVAPQYFIDGTLSGSTGDSTGMVGGSILPLGWFIFAVWSGGDADQVATLNVNGTRQI